MQLPQMTHTLYIHERKIFGLKRGKLDGKWIMLHTRDFVIVVFWVLVTPLGFVGCDLSFAELTACIFRVELNLQEEGPL